MTLYEENNVLWYQSTMPDQEENDIIIILRDIFSTKLDSEYLVYFYYGTMGEIILHFFVNSNLYLLL